MCIPKINMADPYFSSLDREWIHQEIDSILDGVLSMGPNVKSFEFEFAKMAGVRHAVAMNSCTSALEVSLASLGAKGGEVIIPAETFIATGMAVYLAGAIPKFAEISESTFCLDLDDVRKKVNRNTKGIILVHMAGLITPDIEKFRSFCNENSLFLIEDAAHAPGATRFNKKAGSFGHVGCFSFYPTKVITSGEGGMLITDDDDIALYARSQQHRGRDIVQAVEQYSLPGRNIRMTEMAALLGRVQLSHLSEYLTRRKLISEIYQQELQSEHRINIIFPDEVDASSYWKIPVLLNGEVDRELVTRKMNDAGISIDWAYQPALHLQPVFKTLMGSYLGQLPRTEALLKRHICLPCHPRMEMEDAKYVSRSLRTILDMCCK